MCGRVSLSLQTFCFRATAILSCRGRRIVCQPSPPIGQHLVVERREAARGGCGARRRREGHALREAQRESEQGTNDAHGGSERAAVPQGLRGEVMVMRGRWHASRNVINLPPAFFDQFA